MTTRISSYEPGSTPNFRKDSLSQIAFKIDYTQATIYADLYSFWYGFLNKQWVTRLKQGDYLDFMERAGDSEILNFSN